jgi:hypothetical protein
MVCATALINFFQLSWGAWGEVLLALLVLLEALRLEALRLGLLFEFAFTASGLLTVFWATPPFACWRVTGDSLYYVIIPVVP